MTRDQVFAAFRSLGIEPRQCDIAVVEMMGATVEVLAEYVWDHYLGEPSEPSQGDIEDAIWRYADSANTVGGGE